MISGTDFPEIQKSNTICALKQPLSKLLYDFCCVAVVPLFHRGLNQEFEMNVW